MKMNKDDLRKIATWICVVIAVGGISRIVYSLLAIAGCGTVSMVVFGTVLSIVLGQALAFATERVVAMYWHQILA